MKARQVGERFSRGLIDPLEEPVVDASDCRAAGPRGHEQSLQGGSCQVSVKGTNVDKSIVRFIIVILAIAAVGAVFLTTRGSTLKPSLYGEYGGKSGVYAQIAQERDCRALQTTFDRAAANNDRAQPGSAEHKWTLGYMKAADERMRSLGCYR